MPHQSSKPVPHLTSPRPSIAGDRASVQAEVDDFATSITRFQDGLIPEARFLEHRLRFAVG